MDRLERYLFGQGGPSLYTYLETHNVQDFLDKVREYGEKVNPKQESLIEQFKENKTDDWRFQRENKVLIERLEQLRERERQLNQREWILHCDSKPDGKKLCAFCSYCDLVRFKCTCNGADVNLWEDSCDNFKTYYKGEEKNEEQ